MQVTELFTQAMKPYLHTNAAFILGFSGGLDSTVLLHLFANLHQKNPHFTFRAIHIHHGLSQNADQWATHCEKVCKTLNIPSKTIHVSLVKTNSNIEQQAREARYRVFEAEMQEGDYLVTAQHQDDQAETFLLALKRGSGPRGLSGMPVERCFAKGMLIRPLLAISRKALECYAKQHRLDWITDESNHDPRFDRNFLRLKVLPILTARWASISSEIARSAQLCGEQEQLLNALLDEKLHQLLDEQGNLAISPLKLMSNAKRNALFRRWFAYHHQIMPGAATLQQLWHDVVLAREDASPQMKINEKMLYRYQQKLYLLPMMNDVSTLILDWDLHAPLILPDQLGTLMVAPIMSLHQSYSTIRKPLSHEKISIRFHATGNYHIVGRCGSRKLKKLWQECQVPPWQRTRTPLVFYNDDLIAAIGVFVTKTGQCVENEASLTLVHHLIQQK